MRKHFYKRPRFYVPAGLLILVIAGYFIFGGSSQKTQTIEVQPSEFVNQISVSGKVVPSTSANLGFDQSGRVSAVNAKVGDIVTAGTLLASIENSDIRSELLQKQAALQKEQAKMRALQQGKRPEELAITNQNYADATSALYVAIKTAYLAAEDAILNKADQLYTNASSPNPTLNFTTESYDQKRRFENDRLVMGERLTKWKIVAASQNASSTSAIAATRDQSQAFMSDAKSFLDRLGNTVNTLTPQYSGLTQAQIDSYRSVITSAAQELSTAASTFQTADTAWNTAKNNLSLDLAGSNPNDIEAQAAQVALAAADVESTRSKLAKTIVIAPFDGTVTKFDAKIGEIASPNTSLISVISSGNFEIESYVPEVNISALKIGDPAKVTLDAYGDETPFPAKIISIDPAETVRDGVSTYKVKLQFIQNDQRIKSGMTANILITAEQRQNVISIPQGVVFMKNGQKTVQILRDGKSIDVPVSTGSTSSMGQIEITSGLNSGDKVILNPSENQ